MIVPLQLVLAGKLVVRSPSVSHQQLIRTALLLGLSVLEKLPWCCSFVRISERIIRSLLLPTTFLPSTLIFFPFHTLSGINLFSAREDQEFLVKNEALEAERIRAIETGGCPHAAGTVAPFLKATGLSCAEGWAVREDISQNLHALEDLHREFDTQLLLIESGGDNLAANYSRELADYIIYVVWLLSASPYLPISESCSSHLID